MNFFRRKNPFYDPDKIDFDHLLFTGVDIRKLLIPLMVEQFLNSLMGMADTMMVARIGGEAISAVSLVDAYNNLFTQLFVAMATGGTILCSQYLGSGDKKKSNEAANQVALTSFVFSVTLTALCILFRRPLLSLTFGDVEPLVMENSLTYFYVTALSYPFICMFQVGGAFYRAGGNSRFPMTISVISNLMNIAGNAVLIFVFNMGVFGAALSTLLSRVFAMVVIYIFLRLPKQDIVFKDYFKIRPDLALIGAVLTVSIPSGIENGMFQFGKLAIQSSVSTLGTTAIAAQAMAAVFENINGICGIGMGLGLMTIVGQAVGADRKEEAKYYITKITLWGFPVLLISCLVIYVIAGPAAHLAGLDEAAFSSCMFMTFWITVAKPLLWPLSFIPINGMRAAGDVKFSMMASSLSMWLCRVALTTLLIRGLGFGPIAVWIGMFSDWGVRGIVYTFRYFSGKWLQHDLIRAQKTA